ncbi:hypothetical protein PHYSODRAFT_292763 [Phytophthora sojae]|uniref:Crinkler effector protein N-terminal domain-containing protein n=1 Tax=Phytophthora sojae (strain P6497) TaxID=1094619 RepID=G5AIE5_PHYSP|nr:hypothetical protein PHYSODRAFT_292763 [Phytophthora sojae]EGZ04747.1 hypothetical protein PHYSODRAFT_292763 [Phytophthora sojae]|eukprot:XP_009539846.1 hypothetical protein PHYSODRAFT_292763 [Phytophthora sojae]
MVKLFCAIVGAAGSAFEVDIDEGASVSALKDAIKAKNPATITCDANDLQLFLAKKDEGRGAWLPDDDQAALDLEDGKIHEDIQALIDGEKMKATKTLQHWLFEKNEMPPPSTDQIHVLVVVPGHVRVDMEQDSDGGSSTLNASYLPYWRSLHSLLWPMERIQPTKKDV